MKNKKYAKIKCKDEKSMQKSKVFKNKKYALVKSM